jgi:hemolysin III
MDIYLTPIDHKEEKINVLTHFPGILFGLTAMPILIGYALYHANLDIAAGIIVYAICFLLVFTASTLFHLQNSGRLRMLLKKLDHISIYFMIAGTYTPFILIYVNNEFGMKLLVVLWSLSLLGTVFKIFFTGKMEILSVLIYLCMGWMCLTGAEEFFGGMPLAVKALVIFGGMLYSIGVVFYVWRLHAYHHAIWHIFLLIEAICHFTAVSLSL